MYCTNCGCENVEENKFCTNCGNNLSLNNNINNGNKETSLVLGIICLVSSFLVNVLCFIPGIISIIYANKYKKESGKLGVGFGLSLGGMIFSFIVLLISLFFVFIVVSIVNKTNYEDGYKYDYEIEYTYNLPSI